MIFMGVLVDWARQVVRCCIELYSWNTYYTSIVVNPIIKKVTSRSAKSYHPQ